MSMKRVAGIVWNECVRIKPREKALIVTDEDRLGIGKVLWEVGKGLCKECSLVLMKKGSIHGEEPPQEIAKAMFVSDVVIAPTTYSITHTTAVRNARRRGKARVVTMPGITGETFLRAIPLDYRKLERFGERVKRRLEGNEVAVETAKGTELFFKRGSRKVWNGAGLCRKPGKLCNLPDGEVGFSPLEGKSEGRLVVDVSSGPDEKTKFGKIGRVKKPFIVTVEKGEAVDCGNRVLWKWLTSVENGTNLAEFSVGMNPRARVIGNILEDEKVLGTAHVAFGTNKSIGGRVQSSIHLDCVFSKPTVTVDGKPMMRNGKFLF